MVFLDVVKLLKDSTGLLKLGESVLIVPELPCIGSQGLFSERLSGIYPSSASLKVVVNELFPTEVVDDYLQFIKRHGEVSNNINAVRFNADYCFVETVKTIKKLDGNGIVPYDLLNGLWLEYRTLYIKFSRLSAQETG